jgi:hypothetical protein
MSESYRRLASCVVLLAARLLASYASFASNTVGRLLVTALLMTCIGSSSSASLCCRSDAGCSG